GRWLYGSPRVAAGPQPWADLCIPFGEKVGLCGRSPNCPRLNATFAFNRGYQKCPNSCSAFSRLIKVKKQSETQSASENGKHFVSVFMKSSTYVFASKMKAPWVAKLCFLASILQCPFLGIVLLLPVAL